MPAIGDPSWELTYKGTDPRRLPWFVPSLDRDIAEAVDRLHLPEGARALDLGTGPGTAAIHFARQGLQVTGLDISGSAIAQAKERAGALAQRIAWVEGDVFNAPVEGPFDLALDRGLFHVFPDALRGPYVERVASWLRPGGSLVLKCFSEQEPGDFGPRRVTQAEVAKAFEPHFEVVSGEPATFPGTLGHEPKAWLFVLRRR